jgi:proline iminopeptidase
MRWANPRFDEIHLWEGVETNTLLLDKLWGEIFSEIDVTQMTSNLELTVMNGDLDFSIAPLEEWTNIEAAFRSLKLIELKGVSHTPMLENPQQFVDMMLSIHKLKN